MRLLQVEDFKKENKIEEPKDVVRVLQELGLNPKFNILVDADYLFNYMQGDRRIAISEHDGLTNLYISVLPSDNKAYWVSFDSNSYSFSEVGYDRFTNESNQQGKAIVERYEISDKDGHLINGSYAVKVRIAKDLAEIYYYGALSKGMSPLVMQVNPVTLSGITKEGYKITELLKEKCVLNCFMIPKLRGANTLLNGETVYTLYEDLSSFDRASFRR